MTRPRLRALWLALMLSVTSVACHSATGPSRFDVEREALTEASAKWAATNLTRYAYVMRIQCFCAYQGVPIRVVVLNGTVLSRTNATTGEDIPNLGSAQSYTMEGRFAVVSDAIESHAHSISATYDDVTGYPQSVSIDYSTNVADEEYGFTIDALEPVP